MFNRILNLMDKGFNHRYEIIYNIKLNSLDDKAFLDPSVKDLKILAKTIGFTCSLKKINNKNFRLRLNNIPQPAHEEVHHIIEETNRLLDTKKNFIKMVFHQNV